MDFEIPEIKKGILFILGSGASVDSGLSTYRGVNAINGSIVDRSDSPLEHWRKNNWLIEKLTEIDNQPISDTYAMIQAIIDSIKIENKSTIMTQNIDGLIHQVKGANIIELHGTVRESICDYCGHIEGMKRSCDVKTCSRCHQFLRPNIIRMGDNLKVDFRKPVKRRGYDLVVIIGTTLQFHYLRWIIGRAKMSGAKVIHINPDKCYNDPVEGVKQKGYDFVTCIMKPNVRKGEYWLSMPAADGLRVLYNLLHSKEV